MVGKIGVLALQGDVREHSRVLSELGAHPVEVRLPGDLDGLEGLILPGGESTAISLLLGSSGVGDPLRELLAAGLPAFGTCAGMILLASEVLDGRPDQCRFGAIDIAVRRNGFGRQVDSFETELDVPVAGPDPLPAVFIRAPLVERIGPDVEVLASLPPGESSDEGIRRVVACRQGGVLVTSFHPELSGDPRLHQLFLKGC